MYKSPRAGFTLIELLVAVAIIGIIASIVMVALSDSREHSRNVARVAQIREYQKAFDLYYSETGYYPKFGSGITSTMCLGDYADNACWASGTSELERTTIPNAITPNYMGMMPSGENIMFGQGNSTEYEGMIYTHRDYGKAYTIQYFMEGNDKDCLLDKTTASNVGDDTLCVLQIDV